MGTVMGKYSGLGIYCCEGERPDREDNRDIWENESRHFMFIVSVCPDYRLCKDRYLWHKGSERSYKIF